MKIRFLSILLLSVLLVVASGCSRLDTIYDVPDQNVQTNKDTHTAEDVKLAIIRAGTSLGWQMHSAKPGNVVGTLKLRAHTAVVDINYNAYKYSITYKDSDKLKYLAPGSESTDEDGNTIINEKAMIHKNYNKWVRNLDKAIKLQLLAL